MFHYVLKARKPIISLLTNHGIDFKKIFMKDSVIQLMAFFVGVVFYMKPVNYKC